MKLFYTSLKAHEIHHLKNLLESAGIACRLRNERLSTLAGEVPFTECAMQIWLENDSDRALADAILREMNHGGTASTGAWNCARCGEHIENQFTACWNCGSQKS